MSGNHLEEVSIMMRRNTWIIVAIALLLPLSGCGKAGEKKVAAVPPAKVEPTSEKGIRRIILSDHAAKRIGIETGQVSGAEGRLEAPYSALLYDTTGAEWVYTNPEGKTYKRAPVKVDRIEGDKMYLLKGPDAGTRVVTVGAAELYGAEFEVGH